MTTRYLSTACACIALLVRAADADDRDDEAADAAHASTNPLPYVENLKFEPSYTFSHGTTRYRAELQLEPVLPYRGVLIPGLELWDVWSIARLQLTAESLQNANGTAGGFENLDFVDLAAHRFGSLAIGVGFGTVFPMATSAELGPAKWQLGPAAGFHYAPASWISIAALAQGLWSVAGSSEVARQSYATVQPFIALHVHHRVVVVSDAQMSFYWAGGSTTIPVDLGVGYAFTKHFVGTVKGTLTVAGQNDGTFKVTGELTFLP